MKQTKRYFLSLVCLLTFSFSLLPYSNVSLAGVQKKKITISETVQIKDNAIVKGSFIQNKKLLAFTGSFKLTEPGDKIYISWYKVNNQPFKPAFRSVFKTSSKSLNKGQNVLIVGNFKTLFEHLNVKSDESDISAGENIADETEDSGSDSKSDSSDSSGGSTADSGSSSTPDTTAKKPDTTSTAATPATTPATNPDLTVTGTSDESCPHEIINSQINLKLKKITTYSDGSTQEDACRTVSTYDLISTFEGCSPRHDFVQAKTYLQEKVGYVNEEGNFILTKSCHDTETTFVHQKISADCDQHYDRENNLIYQAKKTYYIDTNGNMNFITSCNIDSSTFKTVSPEDYLKEYSSTDRIDIGSLMSFRRFKYYIQVGDNKIYVSDWQDDLTNTMPIFRDYEACSYYHDINTATSYKQYQLVYSSESQKKTVSECKNDSNLVFAQITDDKFCEPHIQNRKIYKKVSTYFTDETGKRVTVADCSVTDQEQTIDPAYITKNYAKCKPRLDFDQNKAIAAYIEEVSIGTQTKEVSTCTEDINTFYPITATNIGCSYRIDLTSSRAVLQNRLFYNDSSENIYVSECKDSDVFASLEKSSDACVPKVSGDQLIDYKETFYFDSNGDKKVVVACAPSGDVLPITEEMKIYDYDTCPDSVDLTEMKSYRRFKTFVDIMGSQTLIKSCSVDTTKYYLIIETENGCNVRHDFSAGFSVLQKRKIYTGAGALTVEVTPCYDTDKKFTHQKMVDNCKPVFDPENNVTFDTKKTYFLDDSSNVTFVTSCIMDISTSKAVLTSDKKKEYTSDDRIDFDTNTAFKRYREYIILSGDIKQYVSPVLDDLSNPMPIEKDYSSCTFFHDIIDKTSYRRYQEAYYRDGVKKVVSDCQKDPLKSFAHITDSKYCVPKISNKLVYTKESTYLLDETSQMVVVKDCALNGQETTLDPGLIQKNYDVCSPRLDFINKKAISAYKEQVVFDENIKTLSDCIEDPATFYTIAETDNGCSYRVDLINGQALLQKRLFYNTGLKSVYISECQDTSFVYEFVKTKETCAPTVSDDGTNFNIQEETYFIDGTGLKRIVIPCSANGELAEISESQKIKNYSTCDPEINIPEMRAYARYEVYAKSGVENVLIQGCTTDVTVSYAIGEDYTSCPIKTDFVNGFATQTKKLYYKKGDADVYVSACIESDLSYLIQDTVTGCTYRIDIQNKQAILQKREYYNISGALTYVTDCHDTDQISPIVSSTEYCSQDLSDDGLFINETKESFYVNYLGEKVIVQACAQTGISLTVPDEYKHRNYENCDHLVDMPNNKVHPQYHTFVEYGGESVMTIGCMPDMDITYGLLTDFSDCDPKIDYVNDEVTELVKWYFKKGPEDIYVTECIESNTKYPIQARSDICEVLSVENEPDKVIEQNKLYYIDSQGQLKYVSACTPTAYLLNVTTPVCSDSQAAGSARYIHNFPAGESYIAVKKMYGSQMIENCHASANHAAMTHYEEGCSWSHDDAHYRSTLNVRTYLNDAITGSKIYLDGCHASQTYVSYSYAGTFQGGGNGGSCGGGFYWAAVPADNQTCVASATMNDFGSWSLTYSTLSVNPAQWAARSLGAYMTGNYIGEYRRYVRPDNSTYDVWFKNRCGLAKYKIYPVPYTTDGWGHALCNASNFLIPSSANDFAAIYLGAGYNW